jgi:hypothetical protein
MSRGVNLVEIDLVRQLKILLSGYDKTAGTYAEIGAGLGMTEGAVNRGRNPRTAVALPETPGTEQGPVPGAATSFSCT